jgi:hypothetical protein
MGTERKNNLLVEEDPDVTNMNVALWLRQKAHC